MSATLIPGAGDGVGFDFAALNPNAGGLWKAQTKYIKSREKLLGRMLGNDELSKTATRCKMDDLLEDLGAGASPLEKLLVERIISCWLALTYYELLYTQQMADISIQQSMSAQKRIDGAHRRYLDSIKALATVRKLQLPNVQVNIGEKQVNIGNMNPVN